MSACGEAHSDRKTATGNITATGAPVLCLTHHATAIPANEQIAASAMIAGCRSSAGCVSNSAQNARGECLFQKPSPVKLAMVRMLSTNACEPSGTANHDTAARIPPVTATPSQHGQ